MTRKPRRRIIIIGLDGLSWPLLCHLSRAGVTPHLSDLIQTGRAGPMNSVRPEISPVAWTSFFTGRSPGEHGIYGFTEFAPGGYNIRFNSSADVGAPFFWDWFGLAGRRSVVLNVPLTYPAQPLFGIMVSGFVSLDYQRAAYPRSVADYLIGSGYRLEADFEKVHQDRELFLDDLEAALAGRFRLLERFWAEAWDLFILVVSDTDRLFHFFLREYYEGGPIKDYFIDFLGQVDGLVGQVVGRAFETGRRQETILILLSDHGFTPVKEEFHLNRWLAGQGWQPGPGPEALALALDPTRIYLNQAPRFPAGRVRAADRERLSAEIISGLSHEPAVAGIVSGADLYSGPQAQYAPDLVVLPADGYEFKAKFNPGPIYAPSLLQGTHTFENAFYIIQAYGLEISPPVIEAIPDLARWLFKAADLNTWSGFPGSG